MVTFKIEVGKTKRDGTHPIYIRVTKDREYKRIRFFLDASAKDITAGGDIKDTMLDVSINEAINSYKHKLLDIGAAVDEWSVTQIAEYLTTQPKKKEEEFVTEGGIRERMTAARLGYRTNQRDTIEQLTREIESLKKENAELKSRFNNNLKGQ